MIISYIGTEKCDLLYYLAKAAEKLKKETLVIDNSITGDFYKALSQGYISEESDVVTRGLITTVRNKEVPKESPYEVTLIYEGLNPEYEDYRDLTLVATSLSGIETAYITDGLINELKSSKNYNYLLLIRDKVTKKQNEEFAETVFKRKPFLTYELPPANEDIVSYFALTNNGTVEFKFMSRETRQMIASMVSDIFGITPKEAKKLIK